MIEAPSSWRPTYGLWPLKPFVFVTFIGENLGWCHSLSAAASLQWACAAVNPRTVNHWALYRRWLRLRCLRSSTRTRRTRGRASEWPTNWHTTPETQTNSQQTPPRLPHLVRLNRLPASESNNKRSPPPPIGLALLLSTLWSAGQPARHQPPQLGAWQLGARSMEERRFPRRASNEILFRRWRHRNFRKFTQRCNRNSWLLKALASLKRRWRSWMTRPDRLLPVRDKRRKDE